MLKDRITVLLAAAVLSTGIGFGIGHSATSPADAASDNSTIVGQLKKLNKSIGTAPSDTGTVRGLLGELCDNATGSARKCGL